MRHVRRTLAPLGARFLVASLLAGAGTATALGDDYSWIAGSGSWGHPSNWAPFGLPGPADFARIGNIAGVADHTVFADRNVAVLGLFLSDGMGFQNEGWRTTVLGPTVLGTGSRIFLSDAVAGSDFITGSLSMTGDNTRIFLEGSMLRVHDTLDIGPGATLIFRDGEARITNPGVGLVNAGQISVGPGASFFTHEGDDALIDLDGPAGGGRVLVSGTSSATIAVRARALTDAFDGEIELGQHARLHMLIEDGWEAAAGSRIRALVGPDAERAEINGLGRHFSLNGSVEVRALGSTGVLRIVQETTVGPEANATVFERGQLRFAEVALRGGTFTSHSESLAHGGTFFDGATDWSGAVTIDGAAQQNWLATVSNPLGATIEAGLLDMDGEDGLTRWAINGPLTVNAGSISRAAGNRFEGELSIAGGLLAGLTINLPSPTEAWTLAGRMDLSGSAVVAPTRLSGSPVRVEGVLVVENGGSRVAADVRVLNNATFEIESGATLRAHGRTAIGTGTTFAGAGTLHNGNGGRLAIEDGAMLGSIGLRNDAILRMGETLGSAGVLTVDRFEQSATGSITMDVGGPERGQDHDVLRVTGGPVSLAGTLVVSPFDAPDAAPFRPMVGDEFTVLVSDAPIEGDFQALPDTLHNGLRYEWETVHEPGALAVRVLRVTTVGCPADLDGDATLTLYDMIDFLNAFEQGTLMADIDGDGQLTLFDFLAFQNAFAAGC